MILTSWILGSFILAFVLEGSDVTISHIGSSMTSPISILTFIIGYALHYLSRFLNRYFKWEKHVGLRLGLGILLSFLLIHWGYMLLIGAVQSLSIPWDQNKTILMEYIIEIGLLSFIISLFYNIIYYANYSYQSYAYLQVAGIKSERRQIKLQLQALKNQLSPHFLFNSLNTISSLIYKDEKKAESFIRHLADAYKFTLDSYDKKLITLEEELKFIKSYQALLKTRFGNDFNIQIDMDDYLNDTLIPPLTIQLLIENASKHNVIDEYNNVLVKIENDGDNIIVKNNKTQSPEKVESFQVGLKNISQRYKLLKGKEINILNTRNQFEVQLPII